MKRRKVGGKPLTVKYMKAYIGQNIVRMNRKLKRAKDSGWYMGSELMKQANSTLRYLYRKYDFDPNVLHGGKNFTSNMRSYNEIRALYNALKKIEMTSAFASKTRLKGYEEEFAKKLSEAKEKAIKEGKRVTPQMYNTTFSERFSLLSDLSSEFHEIFAFLTYNEVETAIAEGNDTIEQLLTTYYRKISDWEWKNEPRLKEKNIMTMKTHQYLYSKYEKSKNKSTISRMFNKITGGI